MLDWLIRTMASIRDLCFFHLYLILTGIYAKRFMFHELYVGRETISSWSLVIPHRDKNNTTLRAQDWPVTCLIGHVKCNRLRIDKASVSFLGFSLPRLNFSYVASTTLPAQINPTILHFIKRNSSHVIFYVLAADIIYILFSTFPSQLVLYVMLYYGMFLTSERTRNFILV